MATLTLRLEVDPETKKKNVVIKLESDSDALPMEHEEQHRRIVEQLIAGGALKAQDLGRIIIEREGGAPPLERTPEETDPERVPAANRK
jgi:hypothetical protein